MHKTLFLAVIALVSLSGHAQVSVARVALEASTLRIPRVANPPALEDFIDMHPSTTWEGKLAHVSEFAQRKPDDGDPATQATDAYLGYDDHSLYVIFVAHDSDPSAIRARMGRREQIADDEDQVGFYLDTFHDGRHAYQFASNPLGVQDDSLYSEDSDTVDESFDTVWDSRGKLTTGGYVVWFSIPFKSLRFQHAPTQDWNIALWRFLGRRQEGSWWPRVSLKKRGILSQAAQVRGLERISPGRNLQIAPYTSWRAYHSVDARDASRPLYTGSSAQIQGGVDSKAILKDSLVLDVTVRPDFSQVESDEPQITTNQRYEVFYPERRPFFTENASYFDVPMVVPSQHLLFTRRIADPDFGARLTGKVGKYAIGALFADDKSPGEAVPASDPLSGQHAYFDVFRVSRDLPGHSNLGLSYLERQFQGSHSRVLDLDTTFGIGQTWKGTIMGAYNWNRSLSGAVFSGGTVDATLTRVARGFNYIGYFLNRAPGFQPAMSFYNHSNWREVGQTFAYQFWPQNSWITRVWTEVYAARNWHYNGDLNWEGVKPMVKVDVKHNTTVTGYVWAWRDAFGPQDFSVLHGVHRFPIVPAYGLGVTSTQARNIGIKVTGEWGTRSNVNPLSGQAPVQARYQQAEADLTFLMARGLRITNSYLFDHNVNLTRQDAIYNSHIARTNWNLQLNRQLSLRFIAQYNATLANPFYTSTATARGFNADFLVTYLVHPGTALYVGYNSNLTQPGPAVGGPPPERFVNDGRQLFVKVSYLFRF